MANEKGQSEKSKAALEAAREMRTKLMERLEDEDEPSLADRLRRCSTVFRLTCANCGKWKEVESGCKNKWCPVCARKIAATRVARYELAAGMMAWPLHVTLTTPPHDDCDLLNLRKLKRGFTSLRRKKVWTDRTTGGVTGFEVTSKSGRFHAHCHSLIDCKWLAHFTPPPQRGDSKPRIAAKCLAASQEFGLTWAKTLGIKSLDPDWCGVIFKVQRTSGEQVTREILKYACKPKDLLESKHAVGDVIRAIQCTRLVTSYGSCYGKRLIQDDANAPARPCECCGEEAWVTDYEIEPIVRRIREDKK
jgi:hypothetical protein